MKDPLDDLVADPLDALDAEQNAPGQDSWDYLLQQGGSLRQTIPLPQRPAYDEMLATVEKPQEFEAQMAASLYLSSVMGTDTDTAFDLQTDITRHLFRQPMSPSQMVSKAMQNEQMIDRAIQAWNSLVFNQKLDEPPSWWGQRFNAVVRGTANVGSGLAGRLATIQGSGQPGYGPTHLSPEQNQAMAAKNREWSQTLWQVAQDPELAAQSDDAVGKTLDFILETTPYITATTAGSLAFGPAGGFLVGHSVGGNRAYRTAIDAGVPEDRARKIEALVGLASGAIETFGGPAADKLMTLATEKIASRLIRAGADFTAGSLIEAAEEGLDEAAAILGESTYQDVDWGQALRRVIGSAGAGLALGGMFKTGSAVMRGITNFRSPQDQKRALRFLAAQGELTEQMVAELEQTVQMQEAADEAQAEGETPAGQGAGDAAGVAGATPAAPAVPDAAQGAEEVIRQGRGGTEAGQGVYATTSRTQAAKYASGEGPLSLSQPQGEGQVIEFGIREDAKIFDLSDEAENTDLFNVLSQQPRFTQVWQDNWGGQKTNRNLWDAAREARIDIQGLLQEQGYQGAKYKTWATEDQPDGSVDFSIWDRSIITQDGGQKVFRGQAATTIGPEGQSTAQGAGAATATTPAKAEPAAPALPGQPSPVAPEIGAPGAAGATQAANEDEARLFSGRQEWINRHRRKIGLDGINSKTRRSWSEALAQAWEQKVPENALRIAGEINAKPRALSDIETAGMVVRSAELETEYADLMARIGPERDAATVADLSARAATIEAEYDAITRAIYATGSEQGRALASRRLTINESYSLVAVKARAKVAKGAELTAQESAKLKDLTDKLAEQTEKVETLEKELRKIQAEAMLKRLKGAKRLAAMTAEQKAADRQAKLDKVRKLMEAGCY